MAGPGVFVTGSSGTSGFVDETTINDGAEHYEFILRATPGDAGQMTPRSGMPLRKVIEASGVPFERAGYVTLSRANGTTAYLPAPDFEEPSPAFEGGNPAVVSIDGASTRFLRPLIVSEPNDVNAVDNIATVSGEALTVGMYDGNIVTVAVTPSTTSVSSGSPVQFTASASGGRQGEAFAYDWSFGDGTTGTGETISHAFAGSGTYEVRVTAVGGQESGGESGPVEIVVGNPPTTSQPGATADPQAAARTPKGASGKGREGRGGKGSKAGQGGKAKHRARGEGEPARQGKALADPGGSHGLPSKSRPKPRPDDAAAASTPTPLPAEPTPVPEEPTVPAPEAATPEAQAPARHPESRPASSAGQRVEGRLVADSLGPAEREEEAGGGSSGEGSRSAAGAIAGAGFEVPVVALMVVGLFAAGALFEWRRGRSIR
ncbi:MAG TPA: PKD domain-containing protein [Solirubrobacterales bacterium]|nr:PKD domain-containing protein [Solirubrobacterales bacterium]